LIRFAQHREKSFTIAYDSRTELLNTIAAMTAPITASTANHFSNDVAIAY